MEFNLYRVTALDEKVIGRVHSSVCPFVSTLYLLHKLTCEIQKFLNVYWS